jgi:hypothetical protein
MSHRDERSEIMRRLRVMRSTGRSWWDNSTKSERPISPTGMKLQDEESAHLVHKRHRRWQNRVGRVNSLVGEAVNCDIKGDPRAVATVNTSSDDSSSDLLSDDAAADSSDRHSAGQSSQHPRASKAVALGAIETDILRLQVHTQEMHGSE